MSAAQNQAHRHEQDGEGNSHLCKFSTDRILLAALRFAIIAVCLNPPHLMAQKGICIAPAECQSSSDTKYNLRYAVRAGKMPHRILRDPPSMSDILAHDSTVGNSILGRPGPCTDSAEADCAGAYSAEAQESRWGLGQPASAARWNEPGEKRF